MKNKLLTLLLFDLLMGLSIALFGQHKLEIIQYPSLTNNEIAVLSDAQSMRYQIGKTIVVNEDLLEQVSTVDNYNFKKVISSIGARAIGLYFNEFKIPEGGSLMIYNPDRTHEEGPFTAASNLDGGSFALPYIAGDQLIFEYTQANISKTKPKFLLREIGYFFRGIPELEKAGRDFGDSEDCQVNVNCEEGDDFTDQRDATVRILVKDGSGFFWCTGTLVNNTDADCAPYILSADHCAENSNSSDFDDFVFYFNYQGAGCSDPVSELAVNYEELTGCQKIAQSQTAGDADSDYILLKLNDTIPTAWDVYYNGWDASSAARGQGGGVGIHHPSGDIKKISTYENAMNVDSWGGVKQNTHLISNWEQTANGFGVTEGGSSGSAIFDNQGLILGTLTGGASVCNQPSSAFDYYGRMSYHWDQDGTAADRRVDVWLDPAQTGILKLNGTRRPCVAQPASVQEKLTSVDIFEVYPNPSSGLLNLNLKETQIQLNVFNELGQLVWQENISNRNAFQLNIEQGMYIVEAISEKGIDRKSVIVTK